MFDFVARLDQAVAQMAAQEPCSARDEDALVHATRECIGSATMPPWLSAMATFA
jgi:hypothetical protein